MDTNTIESLQKALAEMVADYKCGSRFTDNDIRATARRYGIDACDLYEAFNAAITAIKGA